MEFSQEHMQIGGIAKWAKVIKPQVDDFNPEGLWSVELEVDEDTQEALTSNGVQPKKGTENCFVFKRKTKSRKGSDIPAPLVFDSQGEPWDGALIGNGSTINIDVSFYAHPATTQYGLGKWLNAVQVVEHIPYEGKGWDHNPFKPVGNGPTINEDETDVPF